MPYSGSSDPDLPKNVQEMDEEKRTQWVEVFNSVLTKHHDESRAFAAANGAVKTAEVFFVGDAIKALDEPGMVGGFLASWGSATDRDLQNEWFSDQTDFALDWYAERPMLYHHGMDSEVKSMRIGTIKSLEKRDGGLYATAQLDLQEVDEWADRQATLRQAYIKKIYGLIQAGKLSWSSGSVPHLVQKSGGEILFWPIIEGTGTPTPADPRDVARIVSLKSILLDLDLDTDGEPKEREAKADNPAPATGDHVDKANLPQGATMTREEIRELAAQLREAMNGNDALGDEALDQIVETVEAAHPEPAVADMQAAVEASKAVVEDLAKTIKSYLAADAAEKAKHAAMSQALKSIAADAKPESKAPDAMKTDFDPIHIEMRSKYADLTAEDMSYLATMAPSIQGWRPTTPFVREFADKAYKAVLDRQVKLEPNAIKAVMAAKDMAAKSDELIYSTQASYGDEWVPTLWSDQLWNRARQDNVILPRMRVIEMPSNPYELPVESTDPTVYYVPETTSESQLTISGTGNPIPDSKVGTTKVTLTASKLALRVGVSEEATEDSIIPMIAQMRMQATRTILDAMDNVILNADDTASGNINYNGGTPGATDKYMAFTRGLRHVGLVDNSTLNGVSAAGARITMQLLRSARFTLANRYAVRPDELGYVTNTETFATMLGIDEVLTMDKYGPNATVLNGQLANVDGSPVLVTAELGLTDTAGKISSTGGNNVYGQINVVHWPSWVLGYRRRVRVALDYYAPLDAYQMVVTVRFAIVPRDVYSVATLYYLAV